MDKIASGAGPNPKPLDPNRFREAWLGFVGVVLGFTRVVEVDGSPLGGFLLQDRLHHRLRSDKSSAIGTLNA